MLCRAPLLPQAGEGAPCPFARCFLFFPDLARNARPLLHDVSAIGADDIAEGRNHEIDENEKAAALIGFLRPLEQSRHIGDIRKFVDGDAESDGEDMFKAAGIAAE